MKAYILSLGAGLLVGVIYALLNVRSPAPPMIALLGLLGILLGEQTTPVAKRIGVRVIQTWTESSSTIPKPSTPVAREANRDD